MNFFARVGIDFHLILAQVVNFGILVFILYKFVYKPIFKRIEEDEAKLKEAETKSQELDSQRASFEKQKVQEEEQTRVKSESILKEAQDIAKTLREKSLKKTQEEADEILSLAKKEYMYSKKVTKTKTDGLSELFDEVKVYSKLEDIFFSRLMAEIRKGLVKYKGIKTITLEYAHPLRPNKKAEITRFVRRYIGEGTKLELKENRDLIVGYRLMSTKIAIDQNLLYEIRNV